MSAISPRIARFGALANRFPVVRDRTKQILRKLPVSTRSNESVAAARIAAAGTLLNQVDRLEAPSHDLCNRFESMGFPKPQHTPLPLVHPIVAAPNPGTGPVRFLFIGSLIPTKGPLRLVDAFRTLAPKSASLSILGAATPFFGSTDYYNKLRIQVLGTPGAELLPPISSREIQSVLDAHDVLVLPSTWPENSPLVVREASAAGLRTIWSAEGGAHELDPRGRSVSSKSNADLVKALQKEVQIGRMRHPPIRWPTPSEVAEWHIRNSYSN